MAVAVERGAVGGRAGDADVALAHEALAADMEVIAVDLALDPEADPVLGLVAGRDVDGKLPGPGAQRLGDRMMQPRLGRGREAEQVARRDVIDDTDDVDDRRDAMGQGAGLVEHDGVGLGELLHVAAALDDDAGARRMGHRGQHRGRRGDADAGAVIDDHQRQEAAEVRASAPRCRTASPSVGSTRRSASSSAWFCMRVSPIGADSTRWAIWPAVVSVPTRVARTVNWPSRMTVAANAASPLPRVDRQAFARDGLLVDGGEAFDDLAVDRDHLAGIDDDEVADRELGRRDRDDLAVAQDPGALRAEFQQARRWRAASRRR